VKSEVAFGVGPRQSLWIIKDALVVTPGVQNSLYGDATS